jgi:exodeoxyribonuclease V alpha subunit
MLLKGNNLGRIKKVNQNLEIESWSLRTKNEDEQIKMHYLLSDCGYTYEHAKSDINDVTFKCNINKTFNKFPEDWYLLNKAQLKIVYDEIVFWGSNSRKSRIFSTKSKEIADFIQYVVTVNGFRSNIIKEKNRYVVVKYKLNLIKLRGNNGDKGTSTEISITSPKENEFKYCFTTSSSYWVARRNNKIFVTGNSGKTSILKALANIFSRGGLNVELLSPTGKASRRIEECTGRPAQTIHKFLGVKTSIENAEVIIVPKNTVLIVDESSMLDIVLFNKLLDSFNTDTRIILIGDINQLPSVQAGNVLGDLMTYDKISINVLTDIMRQAKNSSIIKYCSRINQGKLIDECTYEDLYYKSFGQKDELLEYFSRLYDKEIMQNEIDNVQVIMPYKKGELGVNKLNNYIRDRYNYNNLDDRYGYKLDDKIMHIKNNYAKGVFNGEVGKVTTINNEEDYLEVTYDTGKIIYEIDDIDVTILAYTCTVHKVQGSEYPVVFVLLDDDNTLLLSRKILYTACSRAKKKLYILAMNNSVEKCILNNYFKVRITKLKEFLNS